MQPSLMDMKAELTFFSLRSHCRSFSCRWSLKPYSCLLLGFSLTFHVAELAALCCHVGKTCNTCNTHNTQYYRGKSQPRAELYLILKACLRWLSWIFRTIKAVLRL